MITVFCDGGARGNPGPAAFGFVAIKDGKKVKEGNGFIGTATNNFAEYTAVVEALKWLSHNFKGDELNFFLDSQLVVLQVNGLYKVKNAAIREFILKIRELEQNFKKVNYKHVPREENKDADRLVNLALDKEIYGS